MGRCRYYRHCCGLVLLLALSPAWADTPEAGLPAAQAALQQCVQQLPASLRASFATRSRRGHASVGRAHRATWRACVERSRDVADLEAGVQLRDALVALARTEDPLRGSEPSVEAEAQAISTALVAETRRRAGEFRMVGSPLWNNFLMHTGARKLGYCYHWTQALATAVQGLPWCHFARSWGVASPGKATENNGLVLTARGASLERGIVYDAWRGAGRPYWRAVQGDRYRWEERFSEVQLRHGVRDLLQPHELLP
ncbi:MAG: hypothetical protein HY696_05460 [Deltaproteobacteria bacterium]|nr:hypothetical protein [Deltaproteobacteria bacterium]